jgi:hypothetical protein
LHEPQVLAQVTSHDAQLGSALQPTLQLTVQLHVAQVATHESHVPLQLTHVPQQVAPVGQPNVSFSRASTVPRPSAALTMNESTRRSAISSFSLRMGLRGGSRRDCRRWGR